MASSGSSSHQVLAGQQLLGEDGGQAAQHMASGIDDHGLHKNISGTVHTGSELGMHRDERGATWHVASRTFGIVAGRPRPRRGRSIQSRRERCTEGLGSRVLNVPSTCHSDGRCASSARQL